MVLVIKLFKDLKTKRPTSIFDVKVNTTCSWYFAVLDKRHHILNNAQFFLSILIFLLLFTSIFYNSNMHSFYSLAKRPTEVNAVRRQRALRAARPLSQALRSLAAQRDSKRKSEVARWGWWRRASGAATRSWRRDAASARARLRRAAGVARMGFRGWEGCAIWDSISVGVVGAWCSGCVCIIFATCNTLMECQRI